MAYKTPKLAGDVTGDAVSNTVSKVNAVSYPSAPGTNTVPVVTSSNTITYQAIANAQVSATAAIAVSKLAAGTSAQVLLNNSTPAPAWTTVSGDSTISNTGAVTVAKINGASVPASGSLSVGNVLQVTGVSTLSYAAVNLVGGGAFVTGSLPTTNQVAQSMGGDASGTTGSATVIKIQGNTVTSGALTKGQFFVASSTSNWAATTLSGDISESASTAGLLTV